MGEDEHEPASELPTTPWQPAPNAARTRPEPDVAAADEHPPATAARTRPEPTGLSDEQVVSRLHAVDRISRFTVLRRLGEGGMGIVSLAYDEELDRKVALKVIRQGFCDLPEHRRRFLREAQSLARLSHPNVVTIYDVGEFCGRPYLAMEYVDGCDLRRWLRLADRTPRDIRRVLVDAGRGLAAAHAAGLVHRDFKPANVLVGADGRARVLDFGLSRDADVPPDAADALDRPRHDTLTVAGRIIGTPAYMSPEQLRGLPLDFRSDQYQFAVVVYEALVGARPFAGKTLGDRLREGFALRLPADTALPRSTQRVLQRALAEDPAHRYPAMDDLLAALTRDPWRRWRRHAGAALLAGTAAGLGYGLTGGDPCAGVDEQQAAVWGPEAREAVRASHPGPGVDHLAGLLDVAARGWASAHHTVCSAHHRGEISGVALDARMRCLGQARLAFTALVDTLREPGVVDLDAALVDANDLPDVHACLALDARDPGPPLPSSSIAAEVDDLRGRLARAVLRPIQSDADTEIRAIADRAAALVYRPLAADALLALGRRETERAEYEAAAQDLESALWLTAVVDDPAKTAETLASLMHVLGDRIGREDLVDRWRAHAHALQERLGPRAPGTARLAWASGAVALHNNRVDEALAEMRRAVDITEALHGPDHLHVAHFLGNLAAALATAGQDTAALRATERARAILERAYGPDHSAVITVLANLAQIHVKLGDPARAIALDQEALVRATRSRGDDHPQVALVLQYLAQARGKAGQHAQARSDLLQARAIQRERLGPHRELHQTLLLLVDAETELGDHPSARFHAGERVDVALAIFPADDPRVLEAFAAAIDVELAADAPPDAALALAERALARPLERGLREAPDLVAYLRFHVARALRTLGRDPRRVADLVAAAEPALAAEPDVYPDELAELAAWRRPPRRGSAGAIPVDNHRPLAATTPR